MSDLNVAKTILQQLGGNRFICMTGAKHFLGDNNSLAFSLPQRMCANKANKVKITLDPSDTYTVKFMSIRGASFKDISEHSMVYADQLKALLSRQTGLALSL